MLSAANFLEISHNSRRTQNAERRTRRRWRRVSPSAGALDSRPLKINKDYDALSDLIYVTPQNGRQGIEKWNGSGEANGPPCE